MQNRFRIEEKGIGANRLYRAMNRGRPGLWWSSFTKAANDLMNALCAYSAQGFSLTPREQEIYTRLSDPDATPATIRVDNLPCEYKRK